MLLCLLFCVIKCCSELSEEDIESSDLYFLWSDFVFICLTVQLFKEVIYVGYNKYFMEYALFSFTITKTIFSLLPVKHIYKRPIFLDTFYVFSVAKHNTDGMFYLSWSTISHNNNFELFVWCFIFWVRHIEQKSNNLDYQNRDYFYLIMFYSSIYIYGQVTQVFMSD